MRDLAQSVHIPPVDAAYASPLAWGWDTWQETWKLWPTDGLARRLDEAKAHAAAFAIEGEGVAQFLLAGRPMLIRSRGGKGGVRWVLEDHELLIMIRANNAWGVTVRFLSAGLWGRGLDALRKDVLDLLAAGGFAEPEDREEPRVSRADYAIDFQSAEFEAEISPEMARNIITHHKKKARVENGGEIASDHNSEIWMCGGRVETLTIGRMPALQMQIYDKTKEITDVSGKEWMYALWKRSELYDPILPVWRFEVRFTKNHLKERNCADYGKVVASRGNLMTEALFKNRLVTQTINGKPTRNADKSKWDMHPLWALMLALQGKKKMLPLGRKVIGRRAALTDQLVSQIAGTLRSATVLHGGDFSEGGMIELCEKAVYEALEDKGHEGKVRQAKDRYEFVDEAR